MPNQLAHLLIEFIYIFRSTQKAEPSNEGSAFCVDKRYRDYSEATSGCNAETAALLRLAGNLSVIFRRTDKTARTGNSRI